jgi:hypothetical protein
MWTLQPSPKYEQRRRKYEKKKKRELGAAEKNLATYFAALELAKPLQIKYGFVHPESLGAVALDQTGGGHGKLAETRLYVYPDTDDEVLHQIIIGDKNTQQEDITYCREYIQELRRNKVHKNESKEPPRIGHDARKSDAGKGTEDAKAV